MRFIISRRVPSASASMMVSMVTAIVACSSGGNVIVTPPTTDSAGSSANNMPTSLVMGTGASSSSNPTSAASSVAPSAGSSSSNPTVASGSSASTSAGGGLDDGGAGGAGTGTGTGTGTGSATGTAPAGDAGQGGPSLCDTAKMPPISATICDGFETTPYAFTSDPAGAMTADTTQFYRGKTSMKFSSSSMAYLTETSTFMQGAAATKTANNNFWGRYWFLSDVATTAAVPQSHAVFGTMMGTDTSNAQADAFHFVGGSRGKLQTQIEFAGDVFSDNEKTPAATDPSFPLMSDGWQCWEWQLTDADTYTFYINGVAIPEMGIVAGKGTNNGGNFSPLPTVTELEIGWQYFGTGLYAGWIDEVAVGPNRIPCGD